MRCGCPKCEDVESYMIRSEKDNCCVCPTCLYRCYACQGDGQALSREAILNLKKETPDMQAFFLRQYAARDASSAAETSVWYPESESPED